VDHAAPHAPASALRGAARPGSRCIGRAIRWGALAAVLVQPLLPTHPVRAEDPAGPPSLDQLLKLPKSVEFESERKGGATRSEWRQRFADARTAVTTAEAALAKAQQALAADVGVKSDWQFTPPGLPGGGNPNPDASANYQLSQEVKRQRVELARAQARLRELEVQANLAGVPDDWRGEPSSATTSGNDSVPVHSSTPRP
jgi:hypothetical protein